MQEAFSRAGTYLRPSQAEDQPYAGVCTSHRMRDLLFSSPPTAFEDNEEMPAGDEAGACCCLRRVAGLPGKGSARRARYKLPRKGESSPAAAGGQESAGRCAELKPLRDAPSPAPRCWRVSGGRGGLCGKIFPVLGRVQERAAGCCGCR